MGTPDALAGSAQLPFLDQLLFGMFNKFAKSAIKRGLLRMIMPDGTVFEYGNAKTCASVAPESPAWMELPELRATVTVKDTDMFYKIVTRHDTGLGEAFMARDFEVDNAAAFLSLITANASEIEGSRGIMGILNWVGDKALYLAHLSRPNTVQGSRKNISEHYDAGNAMYKLFLDDTLTYSGGIHREGDSLQQAQYNKLDSLLTKAGVTKDSHVLEIGCGWGSCAIRAVQTTGCRWTGITVSNEQLIEAQARVDAAGLSESISLLFCDYRDVPGTGVFDAVVSCEMIEAVGHEHLPTYFDMVGRVLKPGGLFAMQVITMLDGRYEDYCNSSDFIRAHIFPGGHLPSMGAMAACAGPAQLHAVDSLDIGPDYAITLREWRRRWMARWDDITALGYSDTFMRKYEFYFAYCEAAFACKHILNLQITWRRDTDAPSPRTADPVAAPEIQGTVDVATYIAIAVYCILAGIVIARQPHMWAALATFGTGAALLKIVNTVSLATVPGFAYQDRQLQVWWCLDAVGVIYSLCLGGLSFLLPFLDPAVLTTQHHAPTLFTSLLVCSATGCLAFQLSALVQHKLYHRCPGAVFHFTLLLLLFGSSAFKREHLSLLALTLPAYLAVVPYLVRKMYHLQAWAEPEFLQPLQFVLDSVLRLGLHAAISVAVLTHPAMWTSFVYCLLAAAGLVYMNAINYQCVADTAQGKYLASAALSLTGWRDAAYKVHAK